MSNQGEAQAAGAPAASFVSKAQPVGNASGTILVGLLVISFFGHSDFLAQLCEKERAYRYARIV